MRLKRSMKSLFAMGTLALALAAQPAAAQLGSSKAPIDITADEGETHNADCTTIWRGSAEALQGTSRLRADVMQNRARDKGFIAWHPPGKIHGLRDRPYRPFSTGRSSDLRSRQRCRLTFRLVMDISPPARKTRSPKRWRDFAVFLIE